MRFILTACTIGILVNCNTETTIDPNALLGGGGAPSCLSLTNEGREACEANATCAWVDDTCVEQSNDEGGDTTCMDFNAANCPDFCERRGSKCIEPATICPEYFSDTSCPSTCAWDYIRQACLDISGTKQYKINAIWNNFNTQTLRIVLTQPVDESYLGRRVIIRIISVRDVTTDSRASNDERRATILGDFAPFISYITNISENVNDTTGIANGVIELADHAPNLGTTYTARFAEGSAIVVF